MKKRFFISAVAICISLNVRAQQEKIQKEDSVDELKTEMSHDGIYFAGRGTDFTEYFIYNENQKQVKQGWFLNFISIKWLPQGNYILQVNVKNKKIRSRFSKTDGVEEESRYN